MGSELPDPGADIRRLSSSLCPHPLALVPPFFAKEGKRRTPNPPLPRPHLTGLETRVLAGLPCTSQTTVLMPFLLSPSLCRCLCFSLSLIDLVTELTRSRVIIKNPSSQKSRFCTKQGFEIVQGQCINSAIKGGWKLLDSHFCLCGEGDPDSPVTGLPGGAASIQSLRPCLEHCHRRGYSKCIFIHLDPLYCS